MHRHHHRPANATNDQVARHLMVVRANALAAGALEGDDGVLADIKEITAAQMVVSLSFARPQLVGLDCRVEGELPGIVRVERQRTMYVLEVPPHPGHHHVSGTELRCSMPRLKNPIRHEKS